MTTERPDEVVLYAIRGFKGPGDSGPDRSEDPSTWHNVHRYRKLGGIIYKADEDRGAWVRVANPSEEVRLEFERKEQENEDRSDLDELPLEDEDYLELMSDNAGGEK